MPLGSLCRPRCFLVTVVKVPVFLLFLILESRNPCCFFSFAWLGVLVGPRSFEVFPDVLSALSVPCLVLGRYDALLHLLAICCRTRTSLDSKASSVQRMC